MSEAATSSEVSANHEQQLPCRLALQFRLPTAHVRGCPLSAGTSCISCRGAPDWLREACQALPANAAHTYTYAACRAVMSKVTGMASPTQIGFGICRAAEAAAHAARIYVVSLQPGQAFLILDFVNAFNTLSRDAILNYVATDLPEILNFVKVYDYSVLRSMQFGT